MNLVAVIEAQARKRPEHPGIVCGDQSLTYGELFVQVDRLARHLESRCGVVVGQRVALHLPNGPEFAVAYLATLKLAAVAVSIGTTLKAREVSRIIQDSGARVLLTTADVDPRSRKDIPEPASLHTIQLDSDRILDNDASCELTPVPTGSAVVPVGPQAPAAILYTSGTTGEPKGAVLTHGNLLFNAQASARCIGSKPDHRHLLFLPLFHCFGQNFIMNTALCTGATLVMMRRFAVDAVLKQVSQTRLTHFYGVPAVYIQVLSHPHAVEHLRSVQYFFSAAAAMPIEVATRFRQRFGRTIYEGYGLTETSPLASYNHAFAYKAGSIGTPIEDVAMKVVDLHGTQCPTGALGEIWIKGPNVMAGYHRRPQETGQVLQDGWFRSGDIGYCDSEGYFFLVDRLKDMINRAGFKVWPREIEEVLYQHPDVEQCAVVGVPDPNLGEAVVAYIGLRAGSAVTAETLDAHCRLQLANYKVPRSFVLDVEIPRNAAGKPLKYLLRAHCKTAAL